MSQSSSGSRAGRRRPPPPRLGWPARSAAAAELDAAQQQPSPETNKRPRRVTFGVTPTTANDQQPQKQLWTVKYAPKSSEELAVAPKKVKEVLAWMQQSESKLLLLVGGPGIGKSATVHCLANELGLEVMEWTESYYDHNGSSLIDQLTPLNAFEQFLQHTATGIQSLELESSIQGAKKKKREKRNGTIVLLDELPNLHGPDAEARFCDILTQHVRTTAVPTILIYSDTAEGKARPDDLERMIDAQTLYAPAYCKIVQIHAPTKAKFCKVVQHICSAERNGGSISPSYYVEELHVRCGGDLRFAITTLQYEMIGDTGIKSSSGSSISKQRSSTKPSGQELRDTKLSSFHALGKLLYAKRQKNVAAAITNHTANDDIHKQQRLPLEFDPERVVEQSGMEVSGVLHFLEYHCVEFFTDIDELATAMGHFSDAAFLVDHPLQSSSSSIFPTAYATSLAGRAVANANAHPSPFKFRQFGTPKVFDVMRKRRENIFRIQTLCSDRTVTAAATNQATFAVDILPFVRKILPPQHYVSSSFLDSYFDPSATSSSRNNNNKQVQNNDEAVAAEQWKEQQEVLRLDDIVDDDDDEW